MLTLKKTVVAVLALGSSLAFAGSMGPVCSAVNVTIPCESTAWDFGAKALYLQPVSNSGAYSYFAQNPNGNYQNFPNNWGWGFMIEGSYHYGTGSDTNINWYHMNRSATKTVQGPFVFPFATTTSDTVGTASTGPKWDAVNVEFGQRVDFGETKNMRLHGGVQFARASNSASVNLTNNTTFTGYTSGSPTFNGFGPRLGADMNYDWGNGLGIYANGAGAVLVGTAKSSNYLSFIAADVPYSNYSSSSQTVISPELEAKLGIKYGYAMAQGDLTLDFGWMWVNYFNVQAAQLNSRSDIVNADFGLQGLYFGLKWLGNVA